VTAFAKSADGNKTATLATLFAAVFIALLGLGIVVPLLPVYADNLGASGTMIGLMIAGFSVSRGVLQPFIGGWSDRHGRKWFLVAGLLVYAVVGFSFTLAASVEHLVIIRIFHGVGSAMIVPIAMSYVAGYAPEGQEGRYMGMLNIALFSGIGFGPVIGGVFKDTLGFDSAFYAMSVAATLSMILVIVMLPPDTNSADRAATPPILTTMRRMSHNVRLLGVLVSRMSTMFIMVPLMAFLPLLMGRFMDASGTEIGIVIAARTLVNAVLQVPFGQLVDRVSRITTLVVGTLVVAVATTAIPFVESFPGLILLFAVIGTGEALIWPTLGALATEEGREYGHGAMMGVFSMAMSVGILGGSLGSGVVVDTIGLKYTFPIIASVLVVSTVASVLMIRTPARGAPQPRQVDIDVVATLER